MEQEELSCLSMEDTELIDDDTVESVSLSSSAVSDADIILSFTNPHGIDVVGVGVVIIFLYCDVLQWEYWLLQCNRTSKRRERFRALNIKKDKALFNTASPIVPLSCALLCKRSIAITIGKKLMY